MSSHSGDGKILNKLVDSLLREGRVCCAEMLVALDPSLRKHLGDRRLVVFLRGKPAYAGM